VSNISFQGINEQFPVAGQDNDTQVFRDNFDTIKQALRVANEEVSDLQENIARTDVDTDYNLKKIQNAVLENVRKQKLVGFIGSNVNINPTTIDFQLGHYQIYRIGSGSGEDPFVFNFINFPGDPSLFGSAGIGVGKVILELYSDGQERTVAFRTSGTTLIKKNNFPLVPEGSFGDVIVKSDSDPVLIEVWRWSADSIYIKYLGFLDTANTESFAKGIGSAGSLLIKGTVGSIQDLPTDAEIGDVYLVTDLSPTRLYAWEGAVWLDLGTFQGPPGPRGLIGLQGTQGTQGTQGIQGILGEQGIQGVDGLFAGQGIQGIQGRQGFQGFQGTFGAQGAQGPQGTQGVDGLFAGQGIQGIQGIQGLQGEQGIQGNDGAFVAQGIQGAQGAQGIRGASINIKGEVQNLSELPSNPDINDAYINRDDGELYLWDGIGWSSLGPILGPQGNQGTQGIQGRQGIQGITGQGIQGIQGPQGNQGTQGSQGTQGLQGFQGIQGRQGIQGLQSPQGTQGTQGLQGAAILNSSDSTAVGGGSITIDLNVGLLTVTLNQSVSSVSFINAPAAGTTVRTILIVTQDNAGNHTINTTGFLYPDNPSTVPISLGANTVSVIEFIAYNGTVRLAHLLGANYS